MELFNFPYHTTLVETVENSSVLELDRGFTFASQPAGPFIKTLTLTMPTMKYYLAPDGTASKTINPTTNILALYEFYLEHGMWRTFTYPSPIFGNLEMKFVSPITLPPVVGNLGAVSNVTVVMKEQPSVST